MTVKSGAMQAAACADDETGAPERRPWSPPKVILSDSVSTGVAVDNKGPFHIPDQKFSSTSTS